MNVAFDPWIPVVNLEGEYRQISLLSAFTEGKNYADLAVQPHERVALMRLFLCVAHAALEGPKDPDEWDTIPEALPKAANTYLEKWRDSFELFHETKPWLQIAGITKEKMSSEKSDGNGWTPVSKLKFSFATGNNTTLFDHEGMNDSRAMSLSETIISMLTFQCFSPGGLISQVFWNGVQTSKSSKDGPCAPSSMYHSFLRGKSLFQTIWFNLISYEDIEQNYTHPVGKPVWEQVPDSIDDKIAIENATQSYLGRMCALTRFIQLDQGGERMLLGDGLGYPSFVDGFQAEPSATVIKKQINNKEERGLLSFRPSRSSWRELGAMIVKRNVNSTGGALFLSNIREIKEFDMVVAALARDQATIVDTAESVFHVSLNLFSDEGKSAYDHQVKNAELVAQKLGWAIETWRKETDHGWEGRLKSAGAGKRDLSAKLHSIAITHYWTKVESQLSSLFRYIDSLGTDQLNLAKEAWHKMLIEAAVDAFEVACSRETPRQIRAFSMGWSKLMSIHSIFKESA